MKLWKLAVVLAAVAMFTVPANAGDPPGDTCATAVPAGSGVDPCDDTVPTGPLGSCATGGGARDKWVTFVATETTHRVRTDLSSAGTDSDFVVYGGDCGSLTEVGCSEDTGGCAGYNGNICVEGLTVGDTYTIQVGSWGDSCSGGYTLDIEGSGNACGDGSIACDGSEECEVDSDCPNGGLCVGCACEAPCPATCAGAIDVGGGCRGETLVDPCCDTDPTGPIGSCTTGDGVLDVWLSFVAETGGVRIRSDVASLGSDSDYVVYSGDCDNLVEVGCSEDDAEPTDEACCNGDILIVGLTAGDTHLIQLGSWGDGCSGAYGITVTPIPGAECGDNIRAEIVGEQCDGDDAVDCEGLCLPPGDANECQCPPPFCGNNVIEVGEICDGTSPGPCATGECAANCDCPDPICGNGIREIGEQCDLGAENGESGCLPAECDCTADCKISTDIVPAVSEWGLVVMVLIGLAAGTVMFGRKRVVTA